MHEDSYRVVGGNNSAWAFLNSNLPKEGKDTESVELTKDEISVELERILNLEKDKVKMVSKLILIIL